MRVSMPKSPDIFAPPPLRPLGEVGAERGGVEAALPLWADGTTGDEGAFLSNPSCALANAAANDPCTSDINPARRIQPSARGEALSCSAGSSCVQEGLEVHPQEEH